MISSWMQRVSDQGASSFRGLPRLVLWPKGLRQPLNVKKQAEAVNRSQRLIFTWVESALLLKTTLNMMSSSTTQHSKRKLKNRPGAEKTKKRPVGMVKWEIPGIDFFFYIPLWLRSSDDQKFSGQY